ncbi:uncharacterized protein LOC142632487 [Castanea sativa]|uniref:uncharacterized protein LOC142632487 n=1 Tax=Castanea sativa TaxID=21020 RepID=UPI003F649348
MWGTIQSQQQMDGFRKVINYCAFQDLGYCGPNFTWCNMQEGENRISLRLDRAFANLEWTQKFEGIKVHHLVDSTSDHSALLLSDSMFQKKIQEKRRALNSLTLQDKDGTLSTEINCLRKEINDLLDDEEIYWGQRAKAHWLKEGDKNTRFFHAQASERHKQNTILGIRDSQGKWCDEMDSIAKAAIDCFDNIYTMASPSQIDEVLAEIPTRVTEEMNESLNRNFTSEEVVTALK